MSKFTPTTRSNDCPVCGDIKAKCRTKDDGGQSFVLCMTNGDAKLFDLVDGWKCVKPGSKGWATFTPDEAQPQIDYEERQQRRAQREAEEKAIYQAGLGIDDRHRAHSQLLGQLSLHPEDQADLERRGLSAETIESFRSIEPGQTLDLPINSKTPGVGFGGRKLLTRTAGYLVPALDTEGRILGFQIRNRTGENPKYPWLSVSGVAPANLQNGEMPITFARGGDGSTLYFCEGILKPLVAAEKLGLNVIGASGGNFASSPEQLSQCISALLPETLVLCPDAGSVENAHVMRSYTALNAELASQGRELKVLWWEQRSKAGGDIDEISREQFESAQLITWAEFAAIAPRPSAQIKFETAKVPASQAVSNKQTKKKQTKAEWLQQQKIERDRRAYEKITAMLGIDTDIDMESEFYQDDAREAFYQPLKQYLKYETHCELISGFASEIQPAGDGRSLIAYDCSQGTGKSNNALIPPALQVSKDGGRVLIFVPTRGLAREFKGRINERAGEDIAATHLDPKYYSASIVVTCPESAYKFKGQKFDLIQIDEANEVLHRIESAELGNAGPQSLSAFRKLLASAKMVAIATAAMSGWTLAAAQTIGGFTPADTQLQRRVRPSTQMQIVEYGNYYQWLQNIIDALHSGQRVAIPTGSQGKGRAIDRILRNRFPNKTGLVLDGAATLANQRSKFLADPDAFLEVTRPDWFIFTPVINSGVSIEGKHFDAQFEYATPHEGAQSISQRSERVRSAIGRDGAITERHIYFSQQGAPTLEAYPDALSWQYWADELADEANAPIGAAAALAKALGAERALKPMMQDAEKFAAMRPNLPHFMALKAFEIIFKRELLKADWQRYGWQVRKMPKPDLIAAEELKSLQELDQKIKIGLIEQKGRTLKKAKTRESEGDIDEINNPFQAARAAKLKIERLLGKNYLSQQSSEFFTAWVADKSANNPGVRAVVRSQLLQIAVTDPDCWQQVEQMKALKFLAGKPDADSDLFWSLPELPAAARDIELAGIMARCPGVAAVISGDLEQWTNQDPQVLAAGLYLIAHSKQIAANTKRTGLVRGAQFSEQMAPAALFNKALELMGYKPAKDKRQGSGARLNEYRLEAEADLVEALMDMKAGEKPDAMKLFRAELKVIRAQSRQRIDTAAKNQILSKALAWVSEKMGAQVGNAIAAIKQRHAVLIDIRLSNLGDAVKMSAADLPENLNQMALIGGHAAAPPPIPLNS
ncbi:MAG: hypothetical protein ACR2FS_05025 [Phormidesmis sp.]